MLERKIIHDTVVVMYCDGCKRYSWGEATVTRIQTVLKTVIAHLSLEWNEMRGMHWKRTIGVGGNKVNWGRRKARRGAAT